MKRGRLPRPAGKVSIGFLHPGHYAACFAESLTDLLLFDLAGQARTAHAHGKLGSLCDSGGIVAGRNRLAKVLLDDSEADWLFMVDSDMGFAHDTIERLLVVADPVERPFVGALCFARKRDGSGPFGALRYRACPTLYDFVDDGDKVGWLPRMQYPRDEVVTVGATGAACVLLHRSLLAKVRERFGDVWFDQITHPKGPTTFSEDLSFCLRVAAVDAPIMVHTGVKTTHDKGSVFLDEDYYDAQQEHRKPKEQP